MLKNHLGCNGWVNAVGLDRDDAMAAIFQEIVWVQGYDAGLVRLGNVREDAIHHSDEHAVFERVSAETKYEYQLIFFVVKWIFPLSIFVDIDVIDVSVVLFRIVVDE